MKKMSVDVFKAFFETVWKPLSNFSSVIGLIATFYLSVFYVPSYVEDITKGRGQVIHESLIDDLQEIIFYEQELTIKDIESLIHGRELQQGVSYEYNPDELLVQVQERFIGNKFIPLEKRSALLERIKSIRITYKPIKEIDEGPIDWPTILSLVTAMLGTIFSLLVMLSASKKFKLDSEVADDIISDQMYESDAPEFIRDGAPQQYEEMVIEVLTELDALKRHSSQGYENQYDFIAGNNRCEYIGEVKWLRRLLGFGTVVRFLRTVSHSGKNGILVINTGITERAKSAIREHNEINKDQHVHVITGKTREFVKSRLSNILKTDAED